ncbi:metallo-beta-lactamase superfamily protein [Dactylonectria macrodidyma]|uniref:Metallo-beta-lactamase superfamily protein n=1 Tax=Dactylonectria macrodidyma TaxID=307937 RepID=A0A9P9EXI9_9HYPO|nr:metallo-beta-lactamase superfamily protein [Dactylonectria macrodidyma]
MENSAVTAKAVRLTFLSTGTVKIRPSMKSQPIANRSILMRRFRSFTDRTWTEPLPIGVFVISHPDGPILFDTGESPLCNSPGYHSMLSVTSWVAATEITPEDGIVNQLKANGIAPGDLQAIVLSHLHGDHAGGVKDLANEAPHVPIYVSSEHWDVFGKHPFTATLQGCTPQHWPKDFAPKMIDFTDEAMGPWKKSQKMTADGKIVAVQTPGHVPGHISLVVRGDNEDGTTTTYFLPGDATYGVELLDREEPDGINDDPMAAFQSLKLIKEFASQTDVVVLPSHDVNTPRLLKDRVVYKPTPVQ